MSVDGWMNKDYTHNACTHVHTHNGIVFSHQKESSPASGNSCMKNGLNKQWMRLEGVVLSETSQAETDRYCMISLIYGISKTEKGNT